MRLQHYITELSMKKNTKIKILKRRKNEYSAEITLEDGSKFYANMIKEDSDDPVYEIAKAYLENVNHPRMFGKYKERFAFLEEKVKKARVQGVILQHIRFCDMHGCENSIFERDLEAMGIPCLKLEREYGPLVETERVKMRAQAFVERI